MAIMKEYNKKRAVIAISGGVDSAVAALLIKRAGYEIIGIFIRMGTDNEDSEAAARRVCQKLGAKFYPVNFAAKFRQEIINYFIASYRKGITPNPCVKCNKFIKFGELLRITNELGAEYLATGHYIRLRKIPNPKFQIPNKSKIQNPKFKLLRGFDQEKDQSYFLYNLTQEQLKRVIFPLGEYTKETMKKIADNAGSPYLKKESQDICFLRGDHNDFLREKIKLIHGPIKTLDNKIIGKHQGLPLYTIGQRKGIEIGGIGPFYAAKTDYKTNALYVVSDKDDLVLYQDKFTVEEVNWISGVEPVMPFKCETVIRYRHKPVKCVITKENNSQYIIKLFESQRAITAGQSAVFYDGDELLGGGVIITSV